MKLHIATVWWDQMDEDPEIFCDPDEAKVDELVRTKLAAEYWDGEMGVLDTTDALDQIGGRVVFDYLDMPSFGILSHEDLTIIHDILLQREEDLQGDIENGVDEGTIAEWGADIIQSITMRTAIVEAIK